MDATPAASSYTRTQDISTSHLNSPPGFPPQRSELLRAALAYARKGKPVFPCKPGGKEPLTPRGHLDATTDPSRITAWWNRWPGANIGIPTGERSGLLVLDVDDFTSLEILEGERGELVATATVSTGGGGMHYLYSYPAGSGIRNSAGKLGPNLDTRGEGGYIVAPPSCTEGPYKVLERHPLAEPPRWLLEALRGDSRPPKEASTAPYKGTVVADSGPVPEGQRNDTLYRLACSMRARGAGEAEMIAELERANTHKCLVPLDADELERIAQSAARHAPGDANGQAAPEVLKTLATIEATRLWGREWRGMGELSARDVYTALIKAAREHGTKIPAGVRVVLSVRALALAAAVSKPTAIKAVRRLREEGLIRKDDAERSGPNAGAFVLLANAAGSWRATLDHSTTRGSSKGGEYASGKTLRAPRLRWSATVRERVGDEVHYATIRRLGKSCGAVLDALERAGGSATIPELAVALNKARTRDLRRRTVARLEAAGVVECSGSTVTLARDWLDALNRERELTGEIAAYRRDMARYAREREGYRERAVRPDRAPSRAEMDAIRELYEIAGLQREASGEIRELTPVPPAPDPWTLYPLIDSRVDTLRGPGVLRDVKGTEARVVLDASPEVWMPLDVSELVLASPGAA